MYRPQIFKIIQQKSFFAKADMSLLKHFYKSFTGSDSKIGHFTRKPPSLTISLMVSCHHTCHRASLCTLHLVLSVPVLMWVCVWEGGEEDSFSVQDGNSRALVTGRSLFRRPLSGTTLLSTSDTTFICHSSQLLLKPTSAHLPFLSYLDPLEDFCFCLFSFHGLLLSVLLICQWKGQGGRVSDGRRDGVREGEGREGEGEGGERLGDKKLCNV